MKLTPEEKKELKDLGIDLDAGIEDEDEEVGSESEEQDSQESTEAEEEGEEAEDGSDKPEGPEDDSDDEPSGKPSGSSEADERMRRLEERLSYYEEKEARSLREAEEAKARQRETKEQEEREAQYVLTDVHGEQYDKRLRALEQREERVLRVVRNQETQAFEGAVKLVQNRYPDLDKYVTPEFRKRALNAVLENPERFGSVNWESELRSAYKSLAFDDIEKRASELERKRTERKEKEKKGQVRKVLPSGSSFQAQRVKTSNSSGAPEGYKDLRSEAMQIIRGE